MGTKAWKGGDTTTTTTTLPTNEDVGGNIDRSGTTTTTTTTQPPTSGGSTGDAGLGDFDERGCFSWMTDEECNEFLGKGSTEQKEKKPKAGPSRAGGGNVLDLAPPTPGFGVELPEHRFPEDDPSMPWTQQRLLPSPYTSSSGQNILNGMNSNEIWALEQALVMAGLVDPEDVTGSRSGVMNVFKNVVKRADQNRVKWQDQLQGEVNYYQNVVLPSLEDGKETEKPQYPAFVAPDYVKPDYAWLATQAKSSMRNALGRDPTSTELNLLTNFISSSHKQEWQANEYAPERSNWEKRARAYETGKDQGPTTIQGYDWESRYSEMFEDRFGDELEHRKRVSAVSDRSNNLFGSIDTISRMI